MTALADVEDLTGQRFGLLTVTRRQVSSHGHVTWLCRCDCGKWAQRQTYVLLAGERTSCGCGQDVYRGWVVGLQCGHTTTFARFRAAPRCNSLILCLTCDERVLIMSVMDANGATGKIDEEDIEVARAPVPVPVVRHSGRRPNIMSEEMLAQARASLASQEMDRRQIAEMMGMSPATLGAYLRGQRVPRLAEA